MLSLLLLQLAASTPDPGLRAPVAVVLTSRRPGAEALAPKVAQRVLESLRREGVAALLDDGATAKELRAGGFSDPRTCQGTRACLRKLAVVLGPRAVVVGVDVAKVGKMLALHLEAVAADREDSLASLDASPPVTGWSDSLAATVVVFVRDVKAGLVLPQAIESTPPLIASDVPTRTELTPGGRGEGPPVDLAAPAPKPKVAPWLFAGGAAVTAGAAVAFGVMSASNRSKYQASLLTLSDGTTGSRLPEPEARALASATNTDAAVAVGAGVISAGLTAAATYFFLKD